MKKINTLKELRQKKGILIATHRGVVTGNIPHNTYPAFETAIKHGTDMIETDLTMCKDGTIVIFHPRQEKNHLGLDIHINEMTIDEVKKLRYLNDCRAATDFGILTLDEFLEIYRNRCLINLDHGWHFFPEMLHAVRKHGMEEQVLIKTPMKCRDDLEYAKIIEQIAPDMMYMPIFKNEDIMTDILEEMDVNFVAAELVFEEEDNILATEDYIRSHHEKGRLLWCNSILYNYLKPLSGGHTDDISVSKDPDLGWGWIASRGFDIIQTDWTLALRNYLDKRN
jgi:glycerophosphoryl diester phosphodiesterase